MAIRILNSGLQIRRSGSVRNIYGSETLHVGTATVIYCAGGCSAFETPRLTYCPERKKYLPDSLLGRPPPNLLSTAAMKNSIYMDRSAPVF